MSHLKLVASNKRPDSQEYLPLIVNQVDPKEVKYLVIGVLPIGHAMTGGIVSGHSNSFDARLTMKRHEQDLGMYCNLILFKSGIVNEDSTPKDGVYETIKEEMDNLIAYVNGQGLYE